MRAVLVLGDRRIEISEDCVGTAQCLSVAPDIFRLDADGRATFVDDVVPIATGAAAEVAEALCPMAAIQITPA